MKKLTKKELEQKRRATDYKKQKLREQKLKEKYSQKGIEIYPSWHDKPKVKSVYLGFSAPQWADLINAEGVLLGSCCADISRIRDVLISAARQGYSIDCDNLFEIASLWCNHCGIDINKPILKKPRDPIDRLIWLWQQVKDEAYIDRVRAKKYNPNDIEDALYLVSSNASIMSFAPILGSNKEFELAAINRWYFSQMLPALKTLWEACQKEYAEPVEGWAVCFDGEVVPARYGLAVYETEQQAQNYLNDLLKYAEIEEDKKKDLVLKKVRLGITGLEYL